MPDKQYIHPIGKKGQVVLPAEFRRALGIKPTDRVGIIQEGDAIVIRLAASRALLYQGIARKARDGTQDWEEISRRAWEERVEEMRKEGGGA